MAEKLKWEDLKECLEWTRKKFMEAEEGKEVHHTAEYWYGYNEALQMVASNMYGKEFFNYLMDLWSKTK